MSARGDESGLYIALDESNHGRLPEILVAVSSTIRSDAVPMETSRKDRMEGAALARFLRNRERDFRYHDMTESVRGNPLVTFAPEIVVGLLKSEKREFDFVDLLFDGELRNRDVRKISSELNPVIKKYGLNRVSIRHYPKSKHKKYEYPRILVAADSLAHYLFRQEEFRARIGAREKRLSLRT